MPYRKTPFRAGECYHLYNRGNNRQPVFFEDENYFYFLRKIREHLTASIADVIAYCLMPNHYHLLVRLQADDLASAMQPLMVAYTKAINKRFERVGALFQGPFQAIHVEREEYLLHLSRYLHLNPVAAGLTTRAEDWEYSSYRDYLGLRAGTLPKPEAVLAQFTPKSETWCLGETGFLTEGARQSYRRFVECYAARDRELIAHLVCD